MTSFSLDVERHRNAIDRIRYKKAAHALAPYSHTGKTPVIPTSGEADATRRKKLTLKDIIALKRALDNAEVPEDGRRLVLCPDHVNDLLEQDQSFKDKFYNYTSGKLLNMYGFQIYTFINCPYYTKEGVKVPYNQAPGETDLKGSFVFYVPRMFRAQGSTKMYYSAAATSPQTQESLVNFRHYYIVLPKKQEAIGAIYSWDGTTVQKKDQRFGRETVGPGETGSGGGSESERSAEGTDSETKKSSHDHDPRGLRNNNRGTRLSGDRWKGLAGADGQGVLPVHRHGYGYRAMLIT